MSEKKKLRDQAMVHRAELALAMPAAGLALVGHLIGHLEGKMPQSISAYWPISTEIDSRPTMERLQSLGNAILLPRIAGKNTDLEFFQWNRGDALVDGPFGTREPIAGARKIRPTILLVPLLAYDDLGGRLGYGGGFYDRTLSTLRGKGETCAIGMAYSGQRVDHVPMDLHDEYLDFIATEAGMVTALRG